MGRQAEPRGTSKHAAYSRRSSDCVGLVRAGVPFVLLEASDGVGGRVRTDKVDGFTLDRGFAIFLTSYPETQVPVVVRLGA